MDYTLSLILELHASHSGPYSYFPVAAFEAAFAKSSTGQARAAEVEAAGKMQVRSLILSPVQFGLTFCLIVSSS